MYVFVSPRRYTGLYWFPFKIIGPTGLFLFHLKLYMLVFVSSKVIGSKLDFKVRTFVTKDRRWELLFQFGC